MRDMAHNGIAFVYDLPISSLTRALLPICPHFCRPYRHRRRL